MRIQRIFKKDNIKGILFALVISSSIWIYAVLNSEYNIYIKVPLNIIPPEKYSVSGKIPEKIDVLISGIGWQILNLTFLPQNATCNVKLEESEHLNDKIFITKNDFIKSTTLGVNAKILDVSPSSLVLEIGKMVEKVVQVEPDITINPRENFIVVGKPIVRPEFVTIFGRKEIVEKIDKWRTSKVILDDVYKPMQIEVGLNDSLRSQLTFNIPKVMVYIDVDLAVEKTIYDIPILVEGGSLPEDHIIFPKQISASVRTGVNKMIESDIVFLDAKVEYSEIIKDTIGIVVPKVVAPYGLTVLSIDPPYLYHWKVTRTK